MKSPVLFLVLCLLLPACDGLFRPDGPALVVFEISHTALVLEVGEQALLTAHGRYEDDLRRQFTDADWTSADPNVVRVGPDGRIEAVGPGRTTVWVRGGEREDSATVVVRAPGEHPTAEWKSIDVGRDATCGITVDGRAHCWGGNYWGQLGQGSRRRVTLTLAPVPVRTTRRFERVAAGGSHTCARTPEHRIFCWGANAVGYVGNGTQSPPVVLPAGVESSAEFTGVWTGAAHSCALDVNGTRYCWGSNIAGQLGIGVVGVEEYRTVPTTGADSIIFAQLALGQYHSCGLAREGSAYCWGTNESAEIGAGPGGPKFVPVPVPVAGGHRYHAISAGGHTCAIALEGATYCWGINHAGQLGVEGIPGSFVPVRVEHDPGFVQISVGMATSCGLTAAGKAYCWGSNRHGKLGTEVAMDQCGGEVSYPCSSRPLPVSGGLTFSQISVGGHVVCGITTDRALYCWGSNKFGQLGTGSLVENSPVPVRVVDPV